MQTWMIMTIGGLAQLLVTSILVLFIFEIRYVKRLQMIAKREFDFRVTYKQAFWDLIKTEEKGLSWYRNKCANMVLETLYTKEEKLNYILTRMTHDPSDNVMAWGDHWIKEYKLDRNEEGELY